MLQKGTVCDLDGDKAVVNVKRESVCDGCRKSGGCGACSQIITIKVENSMGASVGDVVELETDSGAVIAAAGAIFVFPLLTSLAAYFAAHALGGSGKVCGIAAAATLVLTLTAVCIFIRVRKTTLKIRMSAVLSRDEGDK